MEAIVLVVHLVIVIAMVFLILIQRSSSDGLGGLGGSSSNPAGMAQIRGSANVLTRMTSFLAMGFMATSMTLAVLANSSSEASIADTITLDPAEKILGGEEPEVEAPKLIEPEVPMAE